MVVSSVLFRFPRHRSPTMKHEPSDKEQFYDGIMLGLKIAKTIVQTANADRGEIERLIGKIEEQYRLVQKRNDPLSSTPVDGEPEWRAWLIDLEQLKWDREIASWTAGAQR